MTWGRGANRERKGGRTDGVFEGPSHCLSHVRSGRQVACAATRITKKCHEMHVHCGAQLVRGNETRPLPYRRTCELLEKLSERTTVLHPAFRKNLIEQVPQILQERSLRDRAGIIFAQLF